MQQEPKSDILFYVMLAFLAVGFLMSFALPAKSHSWYDPDCCSGADCEPVHRFSSSRATRNRCRL